jgi:hypothetical protein
MRGDEGGVDRWEKIRERRGVVVGKRALVSGENTTN